MELFTDLNLELSKEEEERRKKRLLELQRKEKQAAESKKRKEEVEQLLTETLKKVNENAEKLEVEVKKTEEKEIVLQAENRLNKREQGNAEIEKLKISTVSTLLETTKKDEELKKSEEVDREVKAEAESMDGEPKKEIEVEDDEKDLLQGQEEDSIEKVIENDKQENVEANENNLTKKSEVISISELLDKHDTERETNLENLENDLFTYPLEANEPEEEVTSLSELDIDLEGSQMVVQDRIEEKVTADYDHQDKIFTNKTEETEIIESKANALENTSTHENIKALLNDLPSQDLDSPDAQNISEKANLVKVNDTTEVALNSITKDIESEVNNVNEIPSLDSNKSNIESAHKSDEVMKKEEISQDSSDENKIEEQSGKRKEMESEGNKELSKEEKIQPAQDLKESPKELPPILKKQNSELDSKEVDRDVEKIESIKKKESSEKNNKLPAEKSISKGAAPASVGSTNLNPQSSEQKKVESQSIESLKNEPKKQENKQAAKFKWGIISYILFLIPVIVILLIGYFCYLREYNPEKCYCDEIREVIDGALSFDK